MIFILKLLILTLLDDAIPSYAFSHVNEIINKWNKVLGPFVQN